MFNNGTETWKVAVPNNISIAPKLSKIKVNGVEIEVDLSMVDVEIQSNGSISIKAKSNWQYYPYPYNKPMTPWYSETICNTFNPATAVAPGGMSGATC